MGIPREFGGLGELGGWGGLDEWGTGYSPDFYRIGLTYFAFQEAECTGLSVSVDPNLAGDSHFVSDCHLLGLKNWIYGVLYGVNGHSFSFFMGHGWSGSNGFFEYKGFIRSIRSIRVPFKTISLRPLAVYKPIHS
jgi:hypothetical protein